jgi:uncharacterized circularly permuted ATP-grasp superfamily protein/uncharacterized alpha-E superfamily protein
MDIVKRQEILQVYRDLDPGDLAALVRKARQPLHDLNPSAVDPMPSVVRPEEVPFLREAAAQWGSLLTRVYRDLWGAQELLGSGVLDPGLVWGTLGFDPAFSHVLPRNVEPLSLIRFDLVRDVHGLWRLAALGTEIPRGLGFLLETRIAHGRLFGGKVPHDNLIRLAPFFQGLKDLWFQASLTHKDEPSIAVWTSGPADLLYFEPVALSRYFGYPLVESRDLTVRSGKVFLKTLGGLRPVDVLVRMVADRALDPLAGNPGGFGGVAGLMQAVRDGAVLVTNAPGAGLLGHPALLPFYPAMARHLLGQELTLPPGDGAEAGTEEFFEEGRWVEAPVGVRLFAARLPGGWELMPGGLGQRLDSPSFDPELFGGTKKDLWFLSSSAEPLVSLLPTGEKPSEINRAADLPSRVADDLFWLGRYTERAWVDLRFLEKWWEQRYEGGRDHHTASAHLLDALVKALGMLPGEAETEEAAWKDSRLAETIGAVHQIAGQVLDRLSLETHRILGEFGLFTRSGGEQPFPDLLRQLNLRLAAFSGLTMESMTRSPGWRFLDMGRRLERARLVIEGLREFFVLEEGEDTLSLLLDIFDSTLTYRTRYRLLPQRGPVLDLLLLDETNPRSLAFQLESLSRHVEHLPRTTQRPYWSVEERTILDLTTRIRLTDGTALGPGVLEPFLDGLSEQLEAFAQALHQTYLAKIDPMEALQARGRGEAP